MIIQVIWQSTAAGLATVLGALIVTGFGYPGERLLAVLLGFAGGIMTAVVIFNLIPAALAYGNLIVTLIGFLLGLILMLALDLLISYCSKHTRSASIGHPDRFLKIGYLIAAGIALHDLPEGIAIAVGYSAEENLGLLMALSISLHNIPEGMATAAPLIMGNMSKKGIILLCLLISIFTPIGAGIGLFLTAISAQLVCILLALAGGAMAFIVKSELIPESYRRHPNHARLGFLIGVVLIVCLGFLHQVG